MGASRPYMASRLGIGILMKRQAALRHYAMSTYPGLTPV